MTRYTNTTVVKDDHGAVLGAMMLAAPATEEHRAAFTELVRAAVAAYDGLGPTEAERRRVRSRVLTEYFS